jgi:hypothetical protein
MVTNVVSRVGVLVVAGVLTGCASSPVREAVYGNPGALIALVQAGKIDPNERLQYDGTLAYTPLCVLIGTVAGASAVDTLLTQGADVNKPCSNVSTGLPLDTVIATAIRRGSLSNPYDQHPQYRPEHVPTYMGYAEKLIARGGGSENGPMTMDHVKNRVLEGIEASNAIQPEQVQRYQAQVDSNKAFIQGIASVAGVVVAAKVISDSSGSLSAPSAARIASSVQAGGSPSNNRAFQVDQSASSSAASSGTSNPNNQTANSGEKSQPPVESLIVEPNLYVVDQRPDHWRDRTRAPWKLATGLNPGSGWSRVDACENATRRGKDTIKIDKSQGYIVVTEGLSDCVCHNGGSDTPIRRLWLCEVYYQYKLK